MLVMQKKKKLRVDTTLEILGKRTKSEASPVLAPDRLTIPGYVEQEDSENPTIRWSFLSRLNEQFKGSPY